jgi:methionyl-tRNA formyltransferase
MKIVFMGTPDFAVVSLLKLIGSKHEVTAIVTIPDKAQGRGLKVKSSAVKKAALQNGIETLQPSKLDDPVFIKRLNEIKADIFVVVAFRILPESVFSIPSYGTVNVHASLLPKFRGAAPINWAIIKGEKESGVTTMLINKKVDTGNILIQRKTAIASSMNAGQLHDALAESGANLLLETLEQIESNAIKPLTQNDVEATAAPKIKKETCHLNFQQPVQDVYNLVRGLNPYPAAFSYHNKKFLKIYKSSISNELSHKSTPGTVVNIKKDCFTVSCLDGALDIFEVQLEGKKRMSVKDFFNGYKIELGDRLS